MAKEIERKFLVADDRWRTEAGPGSVMRQGYIAAMDDRTVRVRIVDGTRARLTVKIGKGTMTRDEFEFNIPVEDALELLSSAVGTVIAKTRYRVPGKAHVWEIDVFEEPYDGLIVAEVEMAAETDEPAIPLWLGREVTADGRYSNYALATQPDKTRPDLISNDAAGRTWPSG